MITVATDGFWPASILDFMNLSAKLEKLVRLLIERSMNAASVKPQFGHLPSA